ncbi:MAG: pseudaminic acid synthase [Tagaea sp. CACIAM 22H2]|nr:pseudaminic acid synthase [Tagaea sp. CACIAM 22H2]
MQREFEIAGRRIGPEYPPYVIAEMSGNHNGDIERAKKIVIAAAEAGADAVKLQTYTADTITIDHNGPEFRIESGLWAGHTLYSLYREASTPWEWHAELFDFGRKHGVTVFSSPFDPTAVDFLTDLGAPAFKIASFEIVDLPLIRKVAKTGKPIIVSTGMASLQEIAEAVDAARGAGCTQIVLLHCVSAYPTRPEEANLRTISHLAQCFGVTAGLSDHTMGTGVAAAAVAMGACVIEKHVTIRREDGGPDSAFSLEPNELKELVVNARDAWAALGCVNYERTPDERANTVFRRSLYVVADVAKGEAFTEKNVRSIRPGLGLAPKYYEEILGRRAGRAVCRGTPMSWDLIGD